MDARPDDEPAISPQPGRVDWRSHGVRVVHADELDSNTPQTPGMNRAEVVEPGSPLPRAGRCR